MIYGPSDTWYDPATRDTKFAKNARGDLTGLKKFTNYTVTALAFTKGGGDGVKSPVVAVMTEQDVPGSVSNVKALPMSQDSILVRYYSTYSNEKMSKTQQLSKIISSEYISELHS